MGKILKMIGIIPHSKNIFWKYYLHFRKYLVIRNIIIIYSNIFRILSHQFLAEEMFSQYCIANIYE